MNEEKELKPTYIQPQVGGKPLPGKDLPGDVGVEARGVQDHLRCAASGPYPPLNVVGPNLYYALVPRNNHARPRMGGSSGATPYRYSMKLS